MPLIATAGLMNNFLNNKKIRSLPKISTTLMAFNTGCWTASASLPLLLKLIREAGVGWVNSIDY
jgi:hypothetical protein